VQEKFYTILSPKNKNCRPGTAGIFPYCDTPVFTSIENSCQRHTLCIYHNNTVTADRENMYHKMPAGQQGKDKLNDAEKP
jgi:hypothetical protein